MFNFLIFYLDKTEECNRISHTLILKYIYTFKQRICSVLKYWRNLNGSAFSLYALFDSMKTVVHSETLKTVSSALEFALEFFMPNENFTHKYNE